MARDDDAYMMRQQPAVLEAADRSVGGALSLCDVTPSTSAHVCSSTTTSTVHVRATPRPHLKVDASNLLLYMHMYVQYSSFIVHQNSIKTHGILMHN